MEELRPQEKQTGIHVVQNCKINGKHEAWQSKGRQCLLELGLLLGLIWYMEQLSQFVIETWPPPCHDNN